MTLSFLPITPELEFDCSNYDEISGVLMEVIESTLALGNAQPWSGYLAQTPDQEIVGICAFKGAPDENREVELAWFTFPPYERRGHGTRMAEFLVKVASESGERPSLIAHTEPAAGPSAKICERAGFTCEGEVVVPDDGPLWRWRR